ncbi:ERO1-like protein 2; AltName: Full=Endoplasmic reticulum oxidoreductin-1-like protein B; Flags: Precursor [Serendipita indica DSM 11827]|uniref:Related to endoplasmic oxidoreductin 1 n=1 Tax=Serendipita indica (strain DSM 11827) TaxID=1109443 RepID=G4T4Y0_SERID|nr:ERO1-like protein 2; AltName: Full=Endoplasmic reticulum oxidoreductin-1-like protein B; Flags: Precursor [Serendipita indica DSM 11827]CCA66404.1 related to endoplasmic oxidoreductin 1 precursor [Serendipita indica DSM 11827]
MRTLSLSLCSLLSILYLSSTAFSAAADTFLNPPGTGWKSSSTGDNAQRVLEHSPVKDTDCRQPPLGPIETTLCNYETVESVNDELFETLHQLVETPFFRYYKVDLYRDCPFWEDDDKCASRDCVIRAVDESKIPAKWRSSTLSKVEEPSLELKNSLPGCYYRDSDYCYQDDLSEGGEFIDLIENPERFTGYSGAPARSIWKAIYEENCFGQLKEAIQAETYSPLAMNPLLKLSPPEEREPEGECLEKRVYYKIISGLHASISTHLCYEHLNRETGEWGPNLECFIERVASRPERLQYIYFNTVILLRAIARLGPYLNAYDICSSNEHNDGHAQELLTKNQIRSVISIADRVGKFDESILFRGENAVLKEEFKQHFRNVSSIMDCVGCSRCRLWGKVQIGGLATAMKALFELDEKTLDYKSNPLLLQRSEVVALFNTAHRFTESLHYVDEFRRLWAIAENREVIIKKVEENINKPPEEAKQPRPSPRIGHPAIPRRRPASDSLYDRCVYIAQLCKDGSLQCVRTIASYIVSFARIVASAFTLSGKDGLPHEDF